MTFVKIKIRFRKRSILGHSLQGSKNQRRSSKNQRRNHEIIKIMIMIMMITIKISGPSSANSCKSGKQSEASLLGNDDILKISLTKTAALNANLALNGVKTISMQQCRVSHTDQPGSQVSDEASVQA